MEPIGGGEGARRTDVRTGFGLRNARKGALEGGWFEWSMGPDMEKNPMEHYAKVRK